MKTLKELIGACVLRQVMFAGQLGSNSYTVQDLVHSVNLTTLDTMYKRIEKELASLDGGSLFKTKSSAKKTALRFQKEVIEAVFEYRQDLAADKRAKAKAKEEAVKKLTILTHAADAKEVERIQSLSAKDLAKEIKQAEKASKVVV